MLVIPNKLAPTYYKDKYNRSRGGCAIFEDSHAARQLVASAIRNEGYAKNSTLGCCSFLGPGIRCLQAYLRNDALLATLYAT